MLARMVWRSESWAEIVARAAAAERRRRPVTEREHPAELAARATPWTLAPRARVVEDGLVVGAGFESVEVAFARIYHVEPVDPWPSLALGWVEQDESCSTVLTPPEREEDAFAPVVDEVVDACERRVPAMTARGWLDVAIHAWERVEKLPGEGDEAPAMRGYRMAPAAPDPIVASRTIERGNAALWTWIWARRRAAPRRVEPAEVVLTRAFVYVRTREGRTLRIPVGTLRTARVTSDGDAIYVFGRNTELLLVHRPGCPHAAALEARLGGSLVR